MAHPTCSRLASPCTPAQWKEVSVKLGGTYGDGRPAIFQLAESNLYRS
jgi:hypothetical protein